LWGAANAALQNTETSKKYVKVFKTSEIEEKQQKSGPIGLAHRRFPKILNS